MSKNNKKPKTNAIRIIEKMAIAHEIHTYDVSDGKIDGQSVANKTNFDYSEVFKTLVTMDSNKQYYVFCIPVHQELNLKAASQVTNQKKLAMIPVKDILAITGYIRGGCSPIGMKKSYPTYIDDSANCLDKIVISGGLKGIQVELKVDDLLIAVNGKLAALTMK